MRIVFHLGYPRTGSTFLQKNVFPIHKQINFLGLKNYNNWQDVKISQKDFFNFKTKIDNNLMTSFNNNKLNIISSEFFTSHLHYSNNYDEIQILKKKLSTIYENLEIDFLIVLREQYELIKSLYFHTYPRISKNLNIYKFDELISYFNNEIDKKNDQISRFINSFDYLNLFERIQNNFPNSRVKFLFYEDLLLNKNYFINEFVSFLKLDHDYTRSLFNNNDRTNELKKRGTEIIYTSSWRFFFSNLLIVKKIKNILPKNIVQLLSNIGVNALKIPIDHDDLMKKKIKLFYKSKNEKFFNKTNLSKKYL